MDAVYCHRYVIKDEKKRIVCWHYAFSEYRREWPEVFNGPLPKKPVVESPLVENPHLENPLVENRGQYNTKQIQDVTDIIPNQSNKGARFVRPSIEEVRAYCRERGNTIDPEAFVAYYESKGWKVGTAPMRDWKAAVITWERRRKENTNGNKSSSRLHLGEMEYESSTL